MSNQARQEILSLTSATVGVDAPQELARRQPNVANPKPGAALPAQSAPLTAAGVYAIRNRMTGHVYVSGDLDVQVALLFDRAALNSKQHRNAALQADWDWFREENFTFEVVARIEAPADRNHGKLLQLVEFWRDELRSYGATGYNSRPKLPV